MYPVKKQCRTSTKLACEIKLPLATEHGQHVNKICIDASWNMPKVNAAMDRNVLNFKDGQMYNKKLAFIIKEYIQNKGSMPLRVGHCKRQVLALLHTGRLRRLHPRK